MEGCIHTFERQVSRVEKIGRALEIPFNERKKFESSGEDDDDSLENAINYWLQTECYTPVTDRNIFWNITIV